MRLAVIKYFFKDWQLILIIFLKEFVIAEFVCRLYKKFITCIMQDKNKMLKTSSKC